ncbi:hypothetical protein TNCV_3403981 [Trichonephila clavipes]|nr:hypothetical protein TNCV_3403981 [Trichonephila clavipes]
MRECQASVSQCLPLDDESGGLCQCGNWGSVITTRRERGQDFVLSIRERVEIWKMCDFLWTRDIVFLAPSLSQRAFSLRMS